jgi:hypothetical protein
MGAPQTTRPKVVDYLINVGPGSAPVIAKTLGLGLNAVSKCLWSLRVDGRAHIDSYTRQEGTRRTVYAYGAGEDAKPPPPLTQQERDWKRRNRGPNSVFQVRAEWPQLRAMAALMQKPLTREELSAEIGCKQHRSSMIINAARHFGLIYIYDHVKPNKKRVPRFFAQTTPFEHPDAKLK